MHERLSWALNEIAVRVFRDQSDRDYIAARSCYRMKLPEQFLWLALQAIEKLLKSILLFNQLSARWSTHPRREFRHDLEMLFQQVEQIPDLRLTLPDWTREFIAYLNLYGNNRYLTRTSLTRGNELLRLDCAEWSIRRYAFNMRAGIGTRQLSTEEILAANLHEVNASSYLERPKSFHPFNGFLEEVLRRPSADPCRRALIWKNLYFGTSSRTRLRVSAWRTTSVPPHEWEWFADRELRDQLREFVRLD